MLFGLAGYVEVSPILHPVVTLTNCLAWCARFLIREAHDQRKSSLYNLQA